MLRLFGFRNRYETAVEDAAEQLVAAHGAIADEEAWRAARTQGLSEAERAFCKAVAESVTRLLGRDPDPAH